MRAPSFRLARTPVQVDWSFLLLAALLAMLIRDVALGATLAGVVFTSVLLHEFGHALAFQRYGCEPAVRLHFLGGTTSTRGGGHLMRRQHVVIALAGPLITIVCVGLPAWLAYASLRPDGYASDALVIVMFVNIGWALINLLPVLPLDGGHVVLHLMSLRRNEDRTSQMQTVSFAVATAIAVAALVNSMIWLTLLFGQLAVINVAGSVGRRGNSARLGSDRAPDTPDEPTLDPQTAITQGFGALRDGNPAAARRIVRSGNIGRLHKLRPLAAELEFWCSLREDDEAAAIAALKGAGRDVSDGCRAAQLALAGKDEQAARLYADFLLSDKGPPTRQEAVHHAAMTGHLKPAVRQILERGESRAFEEVVRIEAVLGRIGLEAERDAISELLIG